MAVKDLNKRPFIEDRDDEIFIGINYPFHKSLGVDGWFKSSTTTIDAVKNNIKSLLNTNVGERFFQPTLGLNLKKYLFEPATEDTNLLIEDEIVGSFRKWLPFVDIKDLKITSEETDAIGKNKINIKILFGIQRNNQSLDSIEVTIGE